LIALHRNTGYFKQFDFVIFPQLCPQPSLDVRYLPAPVIQHSRNAVIARVFVTHDPGSLYLSLRLLTDYRQSGNSTVHAICIDFIVLNRPIYSAMALINFA
jgi:hypothetical protein